MGEYTNNPIMTQPAFDVDGMLGRLAKWLRIVGFDAAFPCVVPRPGRVFVTSCAKKRYLEAVYVTARDPRDQLVQVLDQVELTIDPAWLFTRCLECNEPVQELPKNLAIGRVTDEILATRSTFHHCPYCGRVYWDGSHGARIRNALHESGMLPRAVVAFGVS